MAAAATTASKPSGPTAPAGKLTPWFKYPLSALLIFFALAILIAGPQAPTPVGHDASITFGNITGPIFTTWRDPKTGDFFAADRLRRAYVMYGLGHALPAIVWSLLIPVQLSDTLRRKYRTLHRVSGYTVFVSSLIIAITGPLMGPRGLSYTHPDFWHIHSAGSKGSLVPQWLVWPSFELSTTLVEIGFVWTGIQALRKALARDYASHRRWATRFSVAGYTIGIQRVNMVLVNAFGLALAALPADSKLAKDLGVPTTQIEMAEAERAAFALTAFAAGIMGISWIVSVEKRRNARAKTA